MFSRDMQLWSWDLLKETMFRKVHWFNLGLQDSRNSPITSCFLCIENKGVIKTINYTGIMVTIEVVIIHSRPLSPSPNPILLQPPHANTTFGQSWKKCRGVPRTKSAGQKCSPKCVNREKQSKWQNSIISILLHNIHQKCSPATARKKIRGKIQPKKQKNK